MKKEENKKNQKTKNLSNEIILPKISNMKQINKTLNKENNPIKTNIKIKDSSNLENKLHLKGQNIKNINNKISLKKNINKNNLRIIASLPDLNSPKFTNEKLEEYKMKRKERLKREKTEQERGLKIYEQVLKE